MKSARILLIAFTTVLATSIWLTSDPASGQSQAPGYAQPATQATPYPDPYTPLARTFPSANDSEMNKLLNDEGAAEREVTKLTRQFVDTEDGTERSKIKSSLSAALEKEFDLQQKRRELELARVEAQIKKVRELMRKRTDNRQSIIDRRLDQIVREAEGLGWSSPGHLPQPYNSTPTPYAPKGGH